MDTNINLDEKKTVLAALETGEIDLQGQFLQGSNYTFLCQLKTGQQEFRVVYKPVRGEQPLWDFPANTLSKREVAAYLISEALDWNLVPPTVYRRRGPFGPGSLQQYIQHDPQIHYFTFEAEDRQLLRPAVVFDLIINNADRKGSHVLKDSGGHLWFIDHGICFNIEPKLRTVIWDFAGEDIPLNLLEDLRLLVNRIADPESELWKSLHSMLRISEIKMVARRAQALIDSPQFPFPTGQRPYPWPPL